MKEIPFQLVSCVFPATSVTPATCRYTFVLAGRGDWGMIITSVRVASRATASEGRMTGE